MDAQFFASGLVPAGMRAVHGGLAGVGQDFLPIDFTLGYDPSLLVPTVTDTAIAPAPSDVGLPTLPSVPTPDPSGNLVFPDGSMFSAPPTGTSAADAGWVLQGNGQYAYVYADGTKVFNDGTQVNPDGSYYDASGNYYNPATGVINSPTGTPIVAAGTAKAPIPAAGSAVGMTGSIIPFVTGLIRTLTGTAAPTGTPVGGVFRASNGTYYRLNADGTTTAVPYSSALGGGLGGLLPLLLIGGAAFLLLGRKRAA